MRWLNSGLQAMLLVDACSALSAAWAQAEFEFSNAAPSGAMSDVCSQRRRFNLIIREPLTMDIGCPEALPDNYHLTNLNALAMFVIGTYQDILSFEQRH